MSDAKYLDDLDVWDEHAGLKAFSPRKIVRLGRERDRLRGLLREVRMRTQNLLDRQHGDAIIMNPDEYLRATLSLLDAALADQPNGHS